MLRPIKKTESAAALWATQRMMHRFAAGLCDQFIGADDITLKWLTKTLGPGKEAVQEAAWLWKFLKGKHQTVEHLDRARHLAGLNADQKKRLMEWVTDLASISEHFAPVPRDKKLPLDSPFKGDPQDKLHWKNLQDLMEGFYIKGLNGGLAYLPNGKPVSGKEQALNYGILRADFIKLHRIDTHTFAREVCVICDGELRNASIDHWIAKADYPLLSVCADNLVPICGECNERPNKGTKSVHTDGSFRDWFHPYLRHPNGTLRVEHHTANLGVTLRSERKEDQAKAVNLDKVFNLEQRWTREFKAEYRKLFNQIRTRQHKKGNQPLTLESLCQQIDDWADGLNSTQPYYEIHKALAASLKDANHLLVWHGDLNDAIAADEVNSCR